MPSALIVYASNHGHTGKIAHCLAEVLQEEEGFAVGTFEAGAAGDVSPGDYDLVIVGASIHAGHHQRSAIDWVKRHATTLDAMPSAFFSVCLAVADDTDESREAAAKYVDDFLDDTGWTPRQTTTFAGALQYLEYDFVTRMLMRILMRRGHHPTDITQDYDYTDWSAVGKFADDCAAMVAVPV